MNSSQLGMLIGARITLLVGAIVLFILGVTGTGNLLIIASFIVASLYFYLHLLTRRITKRLTREANDDDAR